MVTRTRYTALHKRTVSFDVDAIVYAKVLSVFGGDVIGTGAAFQKAIAAGVSDICTEKANLEIAEQIIKANAEARIKRHEEYAKRPGYAENYVRQVGINEDNMPEYALKIIDKLRKKGMTI